jgi:hypothetical protein
MENDKNHAGLPNQELKAGTYNFTDLVWIIDYNLTAYIGGVTSIQRVVHWLENGLPADLEPRMRATFDVVKPIAEVESEFVARAFLMVQRKELGFYPFPAQMLRDADVETARSVLMRVAAAEFLSNVVPNIDDVASRLQAWIKHAKLPENVSYGCQFLKGELSLVLFYTGFSEEVQRKWDSGVDWPCWDQILAAVPEMSCARSEIDFAAGSPFKYLRSQVSQPTNEDIHK